MKDAEVRKVNIDQLDKCQVMDVNLGSSNESVFLQGTYKDIRLKTIYRYYDGTVYIIVRGFRILKLTSRMLSWQFFDKFMLLVARLWVVGGHPMALCYTGT